MIVPPLAQYLRIQFADGSLINELKSSNATSYETLSLALAGSP
jgi:hypothetical protein